MLFRAADWRFARFTGSRMSRPLLRPRWENDAENPVCVLMTAIRRNFEGSKNREERERVAVKPDVAL